MPSMKDGPSSILFTPLALGGGLPLSQLANSGISSEMSAALEYAPRSECVAWGIPFEVGAVMALGLPNTEAPLCVDLAPAKAQWFIFMHTSDLRLLESGLGGFFSPMRG